MKIFAARLSPNTTAESLQALFEQFGEVTSSKVIMDRETGRSKCYGFVEMADDEQGRQAVEALNGVEYEGSAIATKEAVPHEDYKKAHSNYPQHREGGYQRREGGYQPREGGYQRREGGYQRREGGYQRREGGYQRREGGYQRREGGYQRREGGYQRRDNYSDRGGYRTGGYEPREDNDNHQDNF